MKMSCISIIIPVYNTARYLRECLDSAINQTYRNLEIICVDDGSTDSSPDILKKYAAKDSRIRIVCKKNGGAASARNAGINVADGEYVFFLDSDDYLAVNAMEKFYNRAAAGKLDLVICSAKVLYGFSSDTRKYQYRISSDYPKVMTGHEAYVKMFPRKEVQTLPGIYFIRHGFLKDIDLSFYEGMINEDLPFYFQLFMSAKRLGTISEELFYYRVRKNSISTSKMDERNLYMILIWFQENEKFMLLNQLDGDELQHCLMITLADIIFVGQHTYAQVCEKNPVAAERFIEKLRSSNSRQAELFEAFFIRNAYSWEAGIIKKSLAYKIARLVTFIPRVVKAGGIIAKNLWIILYSKNKLTNIGKDG